MRQQVAKHDIWVSLSIWVDYKHCCQKGIVVSALEKVLLFNYVLNKRMVLKSTVNNKQCVFSTFNLLEPNYIFLP